MLEVGFRVHDQRIAIGPREHPRRALSRQHNRAIRLYPVPTAEAVSDHLLVVFLSEIPLPDEMATVGPKS
jgi:hypothetical protein